MPTTRSQTAAKASATTITTTTTAVASKQPQLLHCFRCHQDYDPNDETDECLIEHDQDSFNGCRNGTDYYSGTLACCGAYQRFHRFYADDEGDVNPSPFCFKGKHANIPSQVKYNPYNIQPCNARDCGAENQKIAKNEWEKQQQAEKEKRKAQEENEKRKWKEARECYVNGQRRTARLIRCEIMGFEVPASNPEMSSDVDEREMKEFDASELCPGDEAFISEFDLSDY